MKKIMAASETTAEESAQKKEMAYLSVKNNT